MAYASLCLLLTVTLFSSCGRTVPINIADPRTWFTEPQEIIMSVNKTEPVPDFHERQPLEITPRASPSQAFILSVIPTSPITSTIASKESKSSSSIPLLSQDLMQPSVALLTDQSITSHNPVSKVSLQKQKSEPILSSAKESTSLPSSKVIMSASTTTSEKPLALSVIPSSPTMQPLQAIKFTSSSNITPPANEFRHPTSVMLSPKNLRQSDNPGSMTDCKETESKLIQSFVKESTSITPLNSSTFATSSQASIFTVVTPTSTLSSTDSKELSIPFTANNSSLQTVLFKSEKTFLPLGLTSKSISRDTENEPPITLANIFSSLKPSVHPPLPKISVLPSSPMKNLFQLTSSTASLNSASSQQTEREMLSVSSESASPSKAPQLPKVNVTTSTNYLMDQTLSPFSPTAKVNFTFNSSVSAAPLRNMASVSILSSTSTIGSSVESQFQEDIRNVPLNGQTSIESISLMPFPSITPVLSPSAKTIFGKTTSNFTKEELTILVTPKKPTKNHQISKKLNDQDPIKSVSTKVLPAFKENKVKELQKNSSKKRPSSGSSRGQASIEPVSTNVIPASMVAVDILPVPTSPSVADDIIIVRGLEEEPNIIYFGDQAPKNKKNYGSAKRCNDCDTCKRSGTPICAKPVGVDDSKHQKLRGFPSMCHLNCSNSCRRIHYEKVADGRCGRLRDRIKPLGAPGRMSNSELHKLEYKTVKKPGPIYGFLPLGQRLCEGSL